MTMTERAYARLIAANPIPDPDRYAAAADLDVDTVFLELEQRTDRDPPSLAGPGPVPRLRWGVALAALLVVLSAGGALLLATFGESDDVSGNAPLEVVGAFFSHWNAGDLEGTMRVVHPDAVINSGFQDTSDLRGLIEWAIEFHGSMEVSCATGPSERRVTCDWAFVTPATEALGITDPQRGRFEVTNGLITEVSTPNYVELELQLGSFARERDPSGYGEACASDGVAPMSAAGFPFNHACGRFLADLEPEFVASRTD